MYKFVLDVYYSSLENIFISDTKQGCPIDSFQFYNNSYLNEFVLVYVLCSFIV